MKSSSCLTEIWARSLSCRKSTSFFPLSIRLLNSRTKLQAEFSIRDGRLMRKKLLEIAALVAKARPWPASSARAVWYTYIRYIAIISGLVLYFIHMDVELCSPGKEMPPGFFVLCHSAASSSSMRLNSQVQR